MISYLHYYVSSFLAAFLLFILPSFFPVTPFQPAESHKGTRPKGVPWWSPDVKRDGSWHNSDLGFRSQAWNLSKCSFVYLKHLRNRSKGSAGHCPLPPCVQSNELYICVSQLYAENWPRSEEVKGKWREFHNGSFTVCCLYQVLSGWLPNSGQHV
jgi:hypothetical protein